MDYEEGMEKLRGFLLDKSGRDRPHQWAVLMLKDNEEYEYYERLAEPCYGGMRRYQERSKNRPNDTWPGDLRTHLFPDGSPVALAVRPWHIYYGHGKSSVEELNEAFRFAYESDASPWVSITKDNAELIEYGGYRTSVLFRDTQIDPTVMVNLLMNARSFGGFASTFCELKKKYPEEEEKLLFILSSHLGPPHNGDYCWNHHLMGDTKGYYQQKPRILTEGTWRDGFDYNRPEVERVFNTESQKNYFEEITKKVPQRTVGYGYGFRGDDIPNVIPIFKELMNS